MEAQSEVGEDTNLGDTNLGMRLVRTAGKKKNPRKHARAFLLTLKIFISRS